VGKFEGECLVLGFGVLEGDTQPGGFGGLLLELVEQYLNRVPRPVGESASGFAEGQYLGQFRARIHGWILPRKTGQNPH
jgi:hypothetical protein